MTNEQAKNMLKAKLECLKRETSGNFFDCNNSNCDECSLCYEQGNVGEQKEALDMAIKALEQEPKTGHWIDDEFGSKCSCCGIHTHLDKFDKPMKFKHCSMCGAKMVESQEGEG